MNKHRKMSLHLDTPQPPPLIRFAPVSNEVNHTPSKPNPNNTTSTSHHHHNTTSSPPTITTTPSQNRPSPLEPSPESTKRLEQNSNNEAMKPKSTHLHVRGQELNPPHSEIQYIDTDT
jgi:hypothetical protein